MSTQIPQRKRLFTAKEVRSFLNITPNTLHKLRKEKKISYIQIGGAFRYDLGLIMDDLIEKGGGLSC